MQAGSDELQIQSSEFNFLRSEFASESGYTMQVRAATRRVEGGLKRTSYDGYWLLERCQHYLSHFLLMRVASDEL